MADSGPIEEAFVYPRPPTPVVVRPARPCRHGVHLVLTIITMGAWSPMWLLSWICSLHPSRRAKIEYY
jgi:hypothetical protein